MTKRAALIDLGALPTYKFDIDSYDPDKLGLGKLMIQKSGVAPADNFAGPFPVQVQRPMEASVTIPFAFPWAMQWSYNATSRKDYIFAADIATAAATRRLGMWEFDRITGQATYRGFLTITFPGTSEAKTIRGLRMSYETYSAGTVGVAGTAVTGDTTAWLTNRCCVGNRIGFGSTDPSQITTWYEISAMASDTGLTLATSAGTIVAGTPYVIEDLRAYLNVTSVTTSLGGLYVIKGLNPAHFTGVGGAVPAATTVDSIKAAYFLKDAASGTALVSFGMAMEEAVSKLSRFLWILETLANPVMFKFDVYAALTLTAGADTSAFRLKTGAGGAVAGTTSQLNNGRLANAAHGPGSGANCIYFTTSTRIYRTQDVSTIVNAATNWVADNMTEVPPGGVSTFALGAGLQNIEYSSVIDKFVVSTTGAAGIRSYMTQYRTDGGQMDRLLFADYKQIDQGSADSSITPTPSQLVAAFTIWIEGGIMYALRFGTTAILNQFYIVPLGADWEYIQNSGARLVLPRIATPDARSYRSAFANAAQIVGGNTGKNLGLQPEPYRLQFRTSGITDNSGGWTMLDDTNNLSGVAGATHIQFRAEFRMGNLLIPARLLNVGVVYEDSGMSDHWQGSSNIGTSLASKQFGFRHSVAYGTTVPRLQIELFDAESGSSLGTDDTTTHAWTWEKSTNAGGAWGAMNQTDRANADTYIRVTPPSLADNIKVRAVLREY
jgi:hypothetical protein